MADDVVTAIFYTPLTWAQTTAHLDRMKDPETGGARACSLSDEWPIFGIDSTGKWWHLLLGIGAYLAILPYMAILTLLSPLMLMLGCLSLGDWTSGAWLLGTYCAQGFFFALYALMSLLIAHICCMRV